MIYINNIVKDADYAIELARIIQQYLDLKAQGKEPMVVVTRPDGEPIPYERGPEYKEADIIVDRHDTPWLQLAEQKLDAAHFAKVLKNYAIMLEQPWRYEVESCYDLSAAFDFDAAPGGADFWLWVEKQIYGD